VLIDQGEYYNPRRSLNGDTSKHIGDYEKETGTGGGRFRNYDAEKDRLAAYNDLTPEQKPLGMRTPLVMRSPKAIPAGQVSPLMALNIDMAPTLLDFAGVAIPAAMQGRSLCPIAERQNITTITNSTVGTA
jgi:arylsulfatase A-like enzyme